MMISDNLIIFVPNIVRAKNNFVRTRLSCFVKNSLKQMDIKQQMILVKTMILSIFLVI